MYLIQFSQDKFLETDLRFLIFTDSVLFSKTVIGHYKLPPSPYKRSLYTLFLPTLGVEGGKKSFLLIFTITEKEKGVGESFLCFLTELGRLGCIFKN